MSQITIEVPKDIVDLVGEAGKAIYVETLKEVAFKRMAHSKSQLEELRKKIAFFERKYKASYQEFEADVPDTVEGHDDWIEWTYLIKASEELSDKINKLSFLMGK
jgi:bacterioferritin (cytochrome b1)